MTSYKLGMHAATAVFIICGFLVLSAFNAGVIWGIMQGFAVPATMKTFHLVYGMAFTALVIAGRITSNAIDCRGDEDKPTNKDDEQ